MKDDGFVEYLEDRRTDEAESAVPAVEPEGREAVSLRDQLARQRAWRA